MESNDHQGPEQGRPDYLVLTDESPMPYGAHVGVKMKDVPASYLLWLSDNDKCNKSVRAYVTDNWEVLCKQAFRDPKNKGRAVNARIDKYLRRK